MQLIGEDNGRDGPLTLANGADGMLSFSNGALSSVL